MLPWQKKAQATCISWLSVQYNDKKFFGGGFIKLRSSRFRPKKKEKEREWEGMGVFLPEVEQDGIFPKFFRGIGMGRDFVLWEWDGRSLKMHSCVTLYCNAPMGKS